MRVKDKYVGVLAFTERPELFADMRAQLSYLWKLICQAAGETMLRSLRKCDFFQHKSHAREDAGRDQNVSA